MKICILESASFSKSCIDAHVRQCVYIRDFLKQQGHTVDLFFTDDMPKVRTKDYDIIIKSYGSFYEDYKNIARICEINPQAHLFWLTNEYDLRAGNAFQKLAYARGADQIANFKSECIQYKKHYFVNLNALFYQPKELQEKKYKICYFGTYRKDRAEYFKKYFTSEDFFLSSSPKNFKKFASLGCKFKPCNKFVWGGKKDTLGNFKYSLYIEDRYTHKVFNNLADRFYEALSNQTVTLFDKSCINTLKQSELKDCNYQDFIINSPEDVNSRDYAEDWKKQSEWIDIVEKQKREALEKIETILKNTLDKEP